MPRRDWRKPFYTEALAELSPSAEGLYRQFDRSLGDGRGAGAGDWRRFDDRMNFVVNFLRSRQQDSTLFWQPFTDEDVGRLWQGAYPARIADPFEQAVRTPGFPSDMRPEDLDASNADCEINVVVDTTVWSEGLPLAVTDRIAREDQRPAEPLLGELVVGEAIIVEPISAKAAAKKATAKKATVKKATVKKATAKKATAKKATAKKATAKKATAKERKP